MAHLIEPANNDLIGTSTRTFNLELSTDAELSDGILFSITEILSESEQIMSIVLVGFAILLRYLPRLVRWRYAKQAVHLGLALCIVVTAANSADARGRGHSRAAAAAAKARKEQMIKALQQQLTIARQVLAAAESKTAMSASEVNQAFGALEQLRASADSAKTDVVEATKSLRDIEQEIWEEQSAESPARKDAIAYEQAKEELHEIIHRIAKVGDKTHSSADAGRLADLASLSPTERASVEADAGYKGALQRLTELGQNAKLSRQQLFEKDADWIAAREELREAQKRLKEGQKQSTTVAVGAAGDRQDLKRANNIATSARMAVAQIEWQLRSLGVKDLSGTATTKRK